MKRFQAVAKRDNVAYFIVSQLNENRLNDKSRPDKRPTLFDLHGSSYLRNNCKFALATYYPAKYGEPRTQRDKAWYGDIWASDPELYGSIMEIWIRKNVLGPVDVPVWVQIDKSTGLLKSIDLRITL